MVDLHGSVGYVELVGQSNVQMRADFIKPRSKGLIIACYAIIWLSGIYYYYLLACLYASIYICISYRFTDTLHIDISTSIVKPVNTVTHPIDTKWGCISVTVGHLELQSFLGVNHPTAYTEKLLCFCFFICRTW